MTNRPIRMLGAGAALLFALTGCSMLPGVGGGDADSGSAKGRVTGCPDDAAATVSAELERHDPSHRFSAKVVGLDDVGPDLHEMDASTGQENITTIGAILGEAIDDACAIEYTVDDDSSFHLVYVPDVDGAAAAIAHRFRTHGFREEDFTGIGGPRRFSFDLYEILFEELASASDASRFGLGVEKDERYAGGVIVLSVAFAA